MMHQAELNLQPLAKPAKTGNTIEERFEAFHDANPHVYESLVKMALSLVRRGRKRIGIGMLFEALRWNYMMQTDDPNSGYKLCNDYRSRYARLIASNVPELKDAFQMRELTSP